jgi:hypothetical protein
MKTEQYEANDWQNHDQPIVARAFVLRYQALGLQNAFDEAFLHALKPIIAPEHTANCGAVEVIEHSVIN